MSRMNFPVLTLLLLISPVGCSLCATPFDLDFVTYGSRTPRSDMRLGRVGSNLSDPSIVGGSVSHSEAAAPLEIQPLETDYESVLESTSSYPPASDMDDEFESSEMPSLLEQRPPSSFKPEAKSRVIRVPSGDSFFDEGF